MIVPMKKVVVVVQKKDSLSALNVLRDLGTVHVELQNQPPSPKIAQLTEEMQTLNKIVEALTPPKKETPKQVSALESNPYQEISQQVLQVLSDIDRLTPEIAHREKLIETWKPWGDFRPQDIQQLVTKGFFIVLAKLKAADFNKIPDDVAYEVVAREGKKALCVFFSLKKMELPFTPIEFPAMSLSEMQSLQTQDKNVLEKAQQTLIQLRPHYEGFKKNLKKLTAELKFETVLCGMGETPEFSYLKGFAPSENSETILRAAQKEKWGVLMEDPSAEDNPPTLLRNPRWIEMIKPIFGIINVVPGYRELDVSFFFLIFFSIFFGMLIGDAGYGILFLVLTFIFQKKMGTKIPDHSPFFLVYILSATTIVWGFMTGTFFGQALLGRVIKPMVPWLADHNNVQTLCFTIGAIHLTIAHGWRAINRINALTALAEVGWILMIWGIYLLTKILIVAYPFSPLCVWLIGAGFLLLVFFHQPIRGVGDILMSFITSFLGFLGGIGDVISYIRLFAVGIAGLAVADAFNQMALSAGFNTVVAGLGAALILVFGHILNIVLSMFAILVHGIRLNILEFSGHLGMEWTGVTYDPLQKNIK